MLLFMLLTSFFSYITAWIEHKKQPSLTDTELNYWDIGLSASTSNALKLSLTNDQNELLLTKARARMNTHDIIETNIISDSENSPGHPHNRTIYLQELHVVASQLNYVDGSIDSNANTCMSKTVQNTL